MGLVDSLRNKLAVKVFQKLGSDAIFYTQSSASTDEYGSKYGIAESSATISAVPYNYVGGRLSYEKFGDLAEGDMDMIVPYDTTVTLKQKVVLLTVAYEVKQIEDYLIDNQKVAIAIRLAKKQKT